MAKTTKVKCPTCEQPIETPYRTSGTLTCEHCKTTLDVPLVLISHEKPECAMLDYQAIIANIMAENQARLAGIEQRLDDQQRLLKGIGTNTMLTAVPIVVGLSLSGLALLFSLAR